MVPTKMNQNWLPSIFNDFFNNEWMMKANATAPAINVIENEKEFFIYCLFGSIYANGN
jgi:HSP20 family protein